MFKHANFRHFGSVLCCYNVDPLNLKYKQCVSFSGTHAQVSELCNVDEKSLLEVD